jgi:hypothetical protein
LRKAITSLLLWQGAPSWEKNCPVDPIKRGRWSQGPSCTPRRSLYSSWAGHTGFPFLSFH